MNQENLAAEVLAQRRGHPPKDRLDSWIDALATGPTVEATEQGYAELMAWEVEDAKRLRAERDAWLAEQGNRPCVTSDGAVYQHNEFIDGGGGVVWCIDGEWAREVDYRDEEGIEHTGFVSIRTGEAIP